MGQKMNMLKVLTTLLFYTAFSSLFGQDPHFSQYFNNSLYTNPANAGFLKGNYRFALSYRSQWNSITKPFTTTSVSFDAPVAKRIFRRDVFALSALVMRDIAGDSKYGFVSGSFGIAYHKSLTRKGNQFLMAGIQYSRVQRSINYNALRFGDQFNGNMYDPDLYTGEKFLVRQFSFSDIQAGIQWYYHDIDGIIYQSGLSISHWGNPNQSLYDGVSVPLKRKWQLTYGNSIPVKERFEIQPGFSYSRQGEYSEFIFGAQFGITQTDYLASPIGLSAGIFNRWNDAVIFLVGASYKLYNFGLSYDLNYSGLRKSSIFRGGPEVSLIITPGKERTFIKREVSCPIF